jgi:hypothetical protein
MIYFTSYAVRKFEILKKHQVELDKDKIKEIVNYPEKTGRKGNNLTAEKNNIKVVYKKEEDTIKIITFYPV